MIPKRVKEMMQKLLDAGFEAFVIGGAVRDMLMNETPHDWDLFTNATGEQILKIFPEGVVIGNKERQEKILTVVVKGVEISQYRKNGERTETGTSLTEHQATCDYTINSIALTIDGDIIDPNGGEQHIINEYLAFVGSAEKRIKEDPLRILRGIRFWCTFGCFKDLNIVLKNIDLLDTLPKERIREEFMKIIRHPQGIENLWCDEIIYKIIPELKDVIGIEGGDHHNEKADEHMKNAFKESCKITDNTKLRLAVFLHDIGKGVTFTNEDEQIHFYEHENKGQEMMEKRLEELKFSNEDIKYITTLIRLHMYSYKVNPGKKSYIKFFNKLDEAKIPIEDFIMLIYCDHQGNLKKPRIKFGDFMKGNWLYKKYYEIKFSEEPMTVKDLKIGGEDVIKILEIEPGIEVGRILNEMFEMVMDGEIKNERAELLHKLKEGLK